MREALPEVLVPEWPTDKEQYVTALESLDCFDTSLPTQEDLMRTRMYARERERAKSRVPGSTLADWLASLGTMITSEKLSQETLPRAAQLFNKTNQMNLMTRRMSEHELLDWATQPNHHVMTFKVSDRFGDAGLTGILGMSYVDDVVTITDFILSCRVMGRLVEEAMVNAAIEFARSRGAMIVEAVYEATNKNSPCLDFWSTRSGFTKVGNVFVTFLSDVPKMP
jgi:FkbH-like protein